MPGFWTGLSEPSPLSICGYEPGTVFHDAARLLTSRLHKPKVILRVEPAEIAYVNTDDKVMTAYLSVEAMNEKEGTKKLVVNVVPGLPV